MMAAEGKSSANANRSVGRDCCRGSRQVTLNSALDIQRQNKSEHTIWLHGCSDIVIQANLSDITHSWIRPITYAISSWDSCYQTNIYG